MELPAQTKTMAFWGGALRGLVGGIALGVAVGLVAAVGLYFGAPMIAAAMSWDLAGVIGFVSTTSTVGGVATTALNVWPLMIFNGILTGVGLAITNGFSKVGSVSQQYENAVLEAKVNQLEGREHQLEQAVSKHMASTAHQHAAAPVAAPTPRHVQKILEEGPRVKVEKHHETHVADAVASRSEDAERAIH